MNKYYYFSKSLMLLCWFIIFPAIISFLCLPLLFEATSYIQQRISILNNQASIIQTENVANQTLSFKIPDTATVRIEGVDYRGFVLDTYFSRYNSPLEGSGSSFVKACEKYGAPSDCTTLAGIAYVETRLCTQAISAKQHNCWGFGGSGSNRIEFGSFDEAIDLITNRLVNNYGIKYMLNPRLMQSTYCGPQCTTWAAGVEQSRAEINRIAIELNLPAMLKP